MVHLNNSICTWGFTNSVIRNSIKRFVPSRVSCMYKEMIVDSYLKNNESNESNDVTESVRRYFLYDACFILWSKSATKGRIPRYLHWDRLNSSINNHFYTDDLIFNSKWKPNKKYAILMEPESLQPKKFKSLLRDKALCGEFEYIFTSNDNFLMEIPNARPLINGGVYIGTSYGGGDIVDEQYKHKNKNISLVSSSKVLCELHKIRKQLAMHFEHGDEVDCFGTYGGGNHIKIADSLMDYRYSIVIENDIQDYWITEKICNCFASMTVPIYVGSPQIGRFFNVDGIITVSKNDIDKIDSIIKKCCREDYEERIPAILDNYNRVKQYYCMEDWMMKQYNSILP